MTSYTCQLEVPRCEGTNWLHHLGSVRLLVFGDCHRAMRQEYRGRLTRCAEVSFNRKVLLMALEQFTPDVVPVVRSDEREVLRTASGASTGLVVDSDATGGG